MVYSAKARLPLQLCQYHLSFALLMYFHSYSLEENYKASQDSLFLAINAKGGEFMGQSKRTAPPPIFKLQKPS
jgi:hypothetical protein